MATTACISRGAENAGGYSGREKYRTGKHDLA